MILFIRLLDRLIQYIILEQNFANNKMRDKDKYNFSTRVVCPFHFNKRYPFPPSFNLLPSNFEQLKSSFTLIKIALVIRVY